MDTGLKVIDSWKITVREEILADIQHSCNGLQSGAVLKSEASGLAWKVISRIIFSQAGDQKRFLCETEHFQRFTFRPTENIEIFKEDIRQKEGVGIHQYAIQAIGRQFECCRSCPESSRTRRGSC